MPGGGCEGWAFEARQAWAVLMLFGNSEIYLPYYSAWLNTLNQVAASVSTNTKKDMKADPLMDEVKRYQQTRIQHINKSMQSAPLMYGINADMIIAKEAQLSTLKNFHSAYFQIAKIAGLTQRAAALRLEMSIRGANGKCENFGSNDPGDQVGQKNREDYAKTTGDFEDDGLCRLLPRPML